MISFEYAENGTPYRGWLMAFVAFTSLALTVGPSSATLPLFYGPIGDDFGWSLTETTLLYTYKNIAAAVATLLLVGPAIVRFGLRYVMTAGFVLTAVSMAAFLVIGGRAAYYAAGTIQGVGLATVIVGSNVLVSRWFHRRHGFALGLALSGVSAGGAVFPLVAEPLLGWVGWRAAMASLSLFVFVVALPLYLWKARENPAAEELGADEWAASSGPGPDARVGGTDQSFGSRTAAAALVRSPGFWRIAFAMLLIAAADMAMVQHTSLVLIEEAGVSESAAALVLSVMFASAVAGKVLAGRLYDRLSVTGMYLWHLFVAASIALTFSVGGLPTLLLFAVARGIAHGGLLPKPAVLAKHCFRPRGVDVALPLLLGIWMVGAGIGPAALSAIVDATGRYRYALTLLVSLCILAALLLSGARSSAK